MLVGTEGCSNVEHISVLVAGMVRYVKMAVGELLEIVDLDHYRQVMLGNKERDGGGGAVVSRR